MLFLFQSPKSILTALAAGVFLVSAPLSASDLVTIQGLQSVPMEQAKEWISSQLGFVDSSGVSMARADDLAFFLENALRERGYNEATVDWKVEGSGANARIILTVSEGATLVVGTITTTGNVALEDAAVLELLTTITRKRFEKAEGEPIPYVADDLEHGRAKIVAFYKLLGFRNVAVSLHSDIQGPRANLALTIAEGSQSKVGDILLPEALSPQMQEKFEEIRAEFTDKTFTNSIPGNLSSKIRSLAVETGYFYATVKTVESGTEVVDGVERVHLAVDATWGEPVRVAGLTVEGNEKVSPTFFNRHFRKIVDKPYSPEDANKAVEELLQTGAFETVRTNIVAQEDGTYMLDVIVEEAYSRTLGVYAGFTNYDGAIGGFEFRNLNLRGSVRRIDAAIEFSKRGGRGEIEYTDPWFLGSDYQFRSGLFAVNRSEEGYEKLKTGGRYEFTKRFGRQMKDAISFFGEASYTDVNKAEIDPVFLGDREYFAHHLGISLTRDRRDNPRRPRSGYIAQTTFSAASSALGSEVEYLKATGRLGYYLPVGDHTLRLGARAGIISPTGDTNAIPIDLRYFNGGPTTVRSFSERGMGTKDPLSGYSIGGNFYTVFNAEYEIPVTAIDGLSLVPFADAGNLIFDEGNAGLDDLRYAIGLGLRYETPIGPIRLEYGHNPDQHAGEPDGTFHIGFGFVY